MNNQDFIFNRRLIKEMKKWASDFEKTQPKNVSIDYDTFEGSAYNLIVSAYVALQNTL